MRASALYSNEFSGFISSRIYWFNLFAVQGTLKSLLQSVFVMVQFSHLYMTTGKNIALTIQSLLVDLIQIDMPLESSTEQDSVGPWSINPFFVLSFFCGM